MAKCWFVGILSVVCCACLLVRVEGYPTDDLVVRLPGQPKVNFSQYAGYVDIDVKHGKSLFYYFVEADHDPRYKPLTLWLNGGPGCSSIGEGAFAELGPFCYNGYGRGLRRNPMSWNRASNLLFVDSPAGTGWSYSNTTTDYNTSDASTVNDMLSFMLKWYEKFPSLKSRELFLTGESYAGHHIPQLANVILDYNAHSPGFKFNMKGVAIGNPALKYLPQDHSIYEFYWSHGMMSDEAGLALRNCRLANESKSCRDAVDEFDLTYIDLTDVILDICNSSIANQELRLKKKVAKISMGVDVCASYEGFFYLNLPEVQKALHANRTNLPYKYSMCSDILEYSDTDPKTSVLPVLKRLAQNDIPVWVFSGDQDSIVPFLQTRTLIRELAHDLKFNVTVPYRPWLSKGQVGGWLIEYGNLLTFATVRGAGHMVPYTQPSKAFTLFNSFVRRMRLPNTIRSSIDE